MKQMGVYQESIRRLSAVNKLEPNSLGIWTLSDELGIGFVILLETCTGEILLIRKTSKFGYEFSGRLTLPGGMIRSRFGYTAFQIDFKYYIQAILEKETGLSLASIGNLEAFSAVTPVTSYTAKGSRRHTLVLPLCGKIPEPVPLLATSSSVEEPQWVHWVEAISLIDELAPANCLVIASYLESRLTAKQKSFITSAVDEAANRCGGWAAELGWLPESFQNHGKRDPHSSA